MSTGVVVVLAFSLCAAALPAAATVPAVAASGDERLRVCVRKRPLLPSELEAGAFDVISCAGRTCVLHETRRRVDLSRTLENHAHAFDAL